MFTGYELSDESRNELLKKFPPKFPDNVIGHHITYAYGNVTKKTPAPPMPRSCVVVGYIQEDCLDGLLVEINGSTDRTAMPGKYHITWSLGEGCKPVDTNKYVDNAVMLANPIDIKVVPKNFKS